MLSAEEPEDRMTVSYVFGVEVEDMTLSRNGAGEGAKWLAALQGDLVLGAPSGGKRPGWAADGASSVRGARRTDLCRVAPAGGGTGARTGTVKARARASTTPVGVAVDAAGLRPDPAASSAVSGCRPLSAS